MNWGYWGSVGVVAEPAYRERMAQAGLGSIEPAEAMEALEYLLAGPVDQMAVLKTTKPLAPVRMPEVSHAQVSWEEMIQTEEMVIGFGPDLHPSRICELWSEAVPDPTSPRREKTDPNQDVE